MHEIKDDELFNLVKAGNQMAFTLLVERYQDLLLMIAHQKLESEDEARDAVQEVLMWLWQKKESVQINSSLRNYLHGAIKNHCLNIIRAHNMTKKRKVHYAYIRETLTTPNDLENKELSIQLQNAISNIAPASRAVFEMQYIDGFSQKEIATKRGIGLQTVKNQVLSALKELRTSLSKG